MPPAASPRRSSAVARRAVDQVLPLARATPGAPSGAARRDHLVEPRDLVDVGVENAVRIGRRAAPFEAAVGPGEQDRLLRGSAAATRRTLPLRAEALRRQRARRRRDVRDVVLRCRSAASAAPASPGTGCVGQVFTPGISRRRASGARESATAAVPVTRSKTNSRPCLVPCATRIDAPPVVRDREQRRRSRQVQIPQIVVDDLVVPEALAGVRVERDDRVGEQVRADTGRRPRSRGRPFRWTT